MAWNRDSNTAKCPCMKCPDKGCGKRHDTCEKFAEFQKRLQAANNARKYYMNSNGTMSDARIKKSWRKLRYGKNVNNHIRSEE